MKIKKRKLLAKNSAYKIFFDDFSAVHKNQTEYFKKKKEVIVKINKNE